MNETELHSVDCICLECKNLRQERQNISIRSEASRKAWDTRRKNKVANQLVPVPPAGIISQQAQRLNNLISLAFAKREAFAAAETDLRDAEDSLRVFIESITAK